ncbi:cell wall-binding repeat-containing protein [Bacillus timonensis]|uniref:cell wall-binding repeat-containing protein n=1 Tax=Bacillus timonensis TaxID=1033734 RepID=UPI000289D156|nr:cell wall-binding repeat-containing protein [Bacillus timonensis]
MPSLQTYFQNFKLQFLFAIIILALLLISFNKAEASGITVDRIKGPDRYETAVKVSQEGWSSAETVVLAVGTNYPDALAGTPLAYSLNAPILLTASNQLPVSTEKEINRLGAKNIILLGGKGSISETVEAQLQSQNFNVSRISGQNRYETSAEIAKIMNTSADTAVVVYGGNFPDSLSIASYAAKKGYPILLTTKDSIPASIKEVLGSYKNTIVVGGEKAVSTSVYAELPGPKRVSGESRYDTSAKIIDTFNLKVERAYLATGNQFADALAGSVLAAKRNSSILLVDKTKVPTAIHNVIEAQGIKSFTIIGGTFAVSDEVVRQLSFDVNEIIETAKSLQGVPYLWGGTTTRGFDCSGYLNYVYGMHGISLPRTTADIYKAGTSVSSPEIGDIVFFETYKPGPSHAGIYLGDGKFIHASSSQGVTITDLSNNYFKPRYLGAKRVF